MFFTVVRAISSEPGLDLSWRREVVKASVRALLSLAVTGREQGLKEIGISQNSLSTMEHGKMGRKSCSHRGEKEPGTAAAPRHRVKRARLLVAGEEFQIIVQRMNDEAAAETRKCEVHGCCSMFCSLSR
jgi:hypothetical protein